jgi:hypothetical protein
MTKKPPHRQKKVKMLVTVKDISLAAKRTPRCIRGTIIRLGWESAHSGGVYLVGTVFGSLFATIAESQQLPQLVRL